MTIDLTDPTEWDDEALTQLAQDVHAERKRRQALARTESDIANTIRQHQTESGRKDGDEWEPPTGYLDAYFKDAIVTWNELVWVSLVDGNTGEPGVTGWRVHVEEGDLPAGWVEPAGYADAYNTGDLVTFEGDVHESNIDGNVWSPTVAPQHWTNHGPVDGWQP